MKQAVTEQLSVLRERVERWRRQRGGKRTRIPEALWKAAVGVARVEGVHATCQALRFNYYSLKDRVDTAESGEQKEPPAAVAFVDLGRGPLGGGATTVVELVGRGGDRMRLDVSGPVDVVGLAQAFWSREP